MSLNDIDEDEHRDGGDAQIRTRFDRQVARTAKIFSWLIFVAFLVTVYEVIARYVFDSPTYWAHETTIFLIALIFLVGGPIALAKDKHIRVRMIYDTVSPRRRRWLDILNSIVAIVFFCLMGYAASTMAWKGTHTPTGAFRLEGTGTAWNPPTPALLKVAILICVIVMLVQTVLHLVQAIRRRTGHSRSGEE